MASTALRCRARGQLHCGLELGPKWIVTGCAQRTVPGTPAHCREVASLGMPREGD